MISFPQWATSEWFVILLMLSVGIMLATRETIIKYYGGRTQTVFNSNAIGVAIFLPALFFVSPPNTASFIWIFSAGVALGIGMTSRMLAYQHADSSVVYPIFKATQVLLIVALGMIIFDEFLSTADYIAIAIVLLGMGLVYLRPGCDMPKFNMGLMFMLFSGLGLAFYVTFDAIGIRQSGTPFNYIPYTVVISSLVAMAITVMRDGLQVIPEFKNSWQMDFWPGVLGNVQVAINIYVLYIAAMAEMMVYAKSAIIFIVLMGIIFLKEPFVWRRIVGSLIILSGIVLLAIF